MSLYFQDEAYLSNTNDSWWPSLAPKILPISSKRRTPLIICSNVMLKLIVSIILLLKIYLPSSKQQNCLNWQILVFFTTMETEWLFSHLSAKPGKRKGRQELKILWIVLAVQATSCWLEFCRTSQGCQ